MAIDFPRSTYTAAEGVSEESWPPSPSNGDTQTNGAGDNFTFNGTSSLWVLDTGRTLNLSGGATYSWDGEKWIAQSHIPFRYYGPLASAPTGMSPDDEGNLYFDTTLNKLQVYNGTAWGDISTAGGFGSSNITTTGNIGIGETSPVQDLVIKTPGPAIRMIDSDNDHYGQITSSSGNLTIAADQGNTANNTSTIFTQDGSEVARFRNGRFTIGLTNPAFKIDVRTTDSNANMRLRDDRDNTAARTIQHAFSYNNVNGAAINVTQPLNGAATDAYMQLRVGGSTNSDVAMHISADRKVAIGSTAPETWMMVNGADTSDPPKFRSRWAADKVFDFWSQQGNGYIEARNGSARGAIIFQGFNGTDTQEYARLDTSGRLLLNTLSKNVAGRTGMLMQIESNAQNAAIRITRNTNSDGSGALIFTKSRGTAVGDNTAVVNNDHLGEIIFAGADGTDHENKAAQIKCEVDGSLETDCIPGRLHFLTTPRVASAVPLTRMTIDRDGLVGIGTDDPEVTFHIKADSAVVRIQDNDTSGNDPGYTQINNLNGNMYFGARNGADNGRIIIGGWGGNSFTEFARFDTNGNLGLGVTTPNNFNVSDANRVVIGTGTGNQGATIYSGSDSLGILAFGDGTSSDEQYRGRVLYDHTDDSMQIRVAGSNDPIAKFISGGTSELDGSLLVQRASGTNITVETRVGNANDAHLTMRKSRGVGGTVQDNDNIGTLSFQGHNGTDFVVGASINAKALDATQANLGTRLLFEVNGANQMLLSNTGDLQFNSGYGTFATAYGVRAWGLLDGNGTIAFEEQKNLGGSLTDNGTGNYTVSFDTAMPDANYVVNCTHGNYTAAPAGDTAAINVGNKTTGSFTMRVEDVDAGVINAHVNIVVVR